MAKDTFFSANNQMLRAESICFWIDFAQILFGLNAVDGILRSSAPALYDDGGKSDDADGEKCQGEEPPINRCALSETLKPLIADVPSQWGRDDETTNEQPDVATREHREDFARR